MITPTEELSTPLTNEQRYHQEQKTRISQYKVNAKDENGNLITKIYARGDEFVIYESTDFPVYESLRINLDTIKEDDTEKGKSLAEIKGDIDKFLAACARYNGTQLDKKRAANAIATAILGDSVKAKGIIENIIKDIKQDYKDIMYGRLFYIIGALSLTITLMFIAKNGYMHRQLTQNNYMVYLHLKYACAFSAIGGLISISLKIKQYNTDRELSKLFYYFNGCERITISVLAGILAYFMIKGQVFFGFLNIDNGASPALLIVCALAGFSESLIPNTLRTLEKKSDL